MGRLKRMIKFLKGIMKVQSNSAEAWFVYQEAESSHFRGHEHILHVEPKLHTEHFKVCRAILSCL